MELPVVQKVCESFLFTYCKDCWLIEQVVYYVSPPHILFLGALLSPLSLPLSLSLSFNGGWKRKGSPRTKSTVPASLFFVKLPCVERKRFAALVADINSVMSLRSWLPNVFGELVLFKQEVARVRRAGILLLMPFSPLHFSPLKTNKRKKLGKLVLQARILMRISALSTSVTKLNYLGSMSMNYATDHIAEGRIYGTNENVSHK